MNKKSTTLTIPFLFLVATSVFALLTAPVLQAQTFQGLGDLPGGNFYSQAHGVSADGSVVVGRSSSDDGQEAFRWTGAGGMQGLGALPGGDFESEARGVSADGSVVVGRDYSDDYPKAFRWMEGGGIQSLGALPGGNSGSEANATSADGSVVAGSGISDNGREAFRWSEGGVMQGLGDFPGGNFHSVAWGVTADGSVVVGNGTSDNGTEAFRWTESGGMQDLGDLPGGNFYSQAYGVSVDGSVVVGEGESDNGREAFRWTEGGGMHGLGDLPGGSFYSLARGVSGDGSVVVGESASSNGWKAFVWTDEDGMRSLQTVLEDDYGVDLTGWTLNGAIGISADGSVIVGTGNNPEGSIEAWRAELDVVAAWSDPTSGFFNEPTRWSIGDIPDESHNVRFDAFTDDFYTVTFVQDQTTRSLTVDSTQVDFDLGGATYALAETDGPALRVGHAGDRPAVLSFYGGTLTAGDAVFGEGPGSSGALGIGRLDAPSTLDLHGSVNVGARGTGLLTVSGGSTASLRSGIEIGRHEDSEGEAFVDGLLQVTEGTLGSFIGYAGAGTLQVNDGGVLSLIGTVNVGSAPTGNGTLSLADGASGTTHNKLQVGVAGVGGLEVTGGAAFTSNDVTLGLQPGSFGTALIEGTGSRWEVGGTMRVGDQGAALVQVQDGAVFCVDTFDYHIGSQGTVQIVGEVVVGEITTCPEALPGKRSSAVVSSRNNGAVLLTPALFLADGAELEADLLRLETGGTLSGDGTLTLPVTNTGRLAPGGTDSIGAFSIEADYVQAAEGVLAIELGVPDSGNGYDQLAVTGEASLGGSLDLLRIGDHDFAVGDTYTVLTASSLEGTFEAVTAPPGVDVEVHYTAAAVEVEVAAVSTSVDTDEVPAEFVLSQNYPNPFNPQTQIRFGLPAASGVSLNVYDLIGRRVAVLVDDALPAGYHTVVFDGSQLGTGIYFYRLEAGNNQQTKKMMLIK